MRNTLRTLCIGIWFLAVFSGCTIREKDIEYSSIEGETMGTTYHIQLQGEATDAIVGEINALLIEINHAVSTYEGQSLLSRINRSDTYRLKGEQLVDSLKALVGIFVDNMRLSEEVYQLSGGAFDPSVGPLVRFWGFGWQKRKPEEIDSIRLDSIVRFVGFDKFTWESRDGGIEVKKKRTGMELDFSAVAKGYAVDRVATLLEDKGIENYLVEIGGELKVLGKNPGGKKWTLGINNPLEGAATNAFYSKVELDKGALATSGNYRNYYEIRGSKIFHSLNPATGYPQSNNLRSASIFDPSCARADALATASMVMGLADALKMIAGLENAEAFFIYEDESGQLRDTLTEGFKPLLLKE